ncbi:MAG: LamG domain-containing protein, partial [Bacteroidales bacterium]
MKTLFTSFLFFVITSFSIAQGSLDSGLVAYFPFNGNAIDETGNGYNGTINGNATLVPDRFNSPDRAFTFPDQSSSISLANSISLNLETGFTINTWVKYKLNSSLRIIVSKHVCGFANGFLFGIDTDGQIVLFLGQSGWSIVRTNQTFVEDQWYMVTATYDATSNIGKVYIDGQLGGNGSVAYNNFSSNPISIGEAYQNNCAAANMNGAVDEVKIYNRPLSDAEILEEYNNTYSDLVLFLPFNGNANDESGSGNNGTVNGAALTQDRFGVNNKAYQFDGVNDYI